MRLIIIVDARRRGDGGGGRVWNVLVELLVSIGIVFVVDHINDFPLIIIGCI